MKKTSLLRIAATVSIAVAGAISMTGCSLGDTVYEHSDVPAGPTNSTPVKSVTSFYDENSATDVAVYSFEDENSICYVTVTYDNSATSCVAKASAE